MADNVLLNSGSGGETLATDDIAGIQYQRVKLADGTADSTALISGDATNGLEVNVTKLIPGSGATNLGKAEDAAHSSGDVGVMAMSLRRNTASSTSGADNDYQPLITDTNGRLHVLDANTAAIQAAVEIMDDWDESNRAKVNPIAGQAGVQGGTGTDTVLTQRVSLATNVALPAGTNAIGKLAANDGVDIGDVDVKSQIPGTGATNLGKARDDPAGGTDTGVALLGIHTDVNAHLASANDDYDAVRLSNFGALHTAPEQHVVFDDLNATTGWAALGNDTLNLATTKKHLVGTDALTFDKVDGLANTIFGGIDKTISSLDLGTISLHDVIQTACYIPALTLVSYVFIRLGTNSSNYNEWRLEDTALTAATFLPLVFNVGDANNAGITGNGWDSTAITYIAVGVAFDAETNALAGIIFDELSFHTNQHTSTELNAEVSTSVSTANINLHKIGGSSTDKGAGNASNGSQRVVLATDDINTAAIKVAVEIMDDWDETNRAAVNPISGQAGVAGGTGTDAATVQRVSLATDIALPAGTNNIGDVDVLTLPSLPAGTNLVGDVGLSGARTSGGVPSRFRSIDLDQTEEELKATAGQIYWIHCMNLSASVVFLRFYNLTAANVTVGTSAIELTFPIATQGDTNGAGFFASFPNGIEFDTAITAACTTGIADNDTGAPAANVCILNVGYA